MNSHLDRLKTIIDAAKAKDNDGFLSHFTADIEYVYHPHAKPIHGIATLRKFVQRYHDTLELTVWEIHCWAVNGSSLLVEGYEEYRVKETGELVGHPYMGILEFALDGRVRRMREYFEMEGKPRAA